jgi:hypothetical protein
MESKDKARKPSQGRNRPHRDSIYVSRNSGRSLDTGPDRALDHCPIIEAYALNIFSRGGRGEPPESGTGHNSRRSFDRKTKAPPWSGRANAARVAKRGFESRRIITWAIHESMR